ncbi:hypothetical protein [Pseudogemmobacter bohemicus]|uniref:hypothetical protein n=1 Tax=Pseudogemmobacter bohemicus TaxID=2250708 RepID=UPI000DD37B94|nr:hypothetical protein [Pseudogemmobacter bohemicus]
MQFFRINPVFPVDRCAVSAYKEGVQKGRTTQPEAQKEKMMDYETISLILQAGQLAVGIAALIAVLTR